MRDHPEKISDEEHAVIKVVAAVTVGTGHLVAGLVKGAVRAITGQGHGR